jgi:hypothetical protein
VSHYAHLKTETDSALETLCHPVIYNFGQQTNFIIPVIMNILHLRQNRLDSSSNKGQYIKSVALTVIIVTSITHVTGC